MNWKLILQLSLFGLAMGIATVFVIPSTVEPFCWLVIFLFCAFVIARNAPARPFLHGLLVGITNGIWITLAHVLLFEPYIARHPQEAERMRAMASPGSGRLMTAVLGPAIGCVSGVVLGFFALAAWYALRRKSAGASRLP
jgi:hypothetical protein